MTTPTRDEAVRNPPSKWTVTELIDELRPYAAKSSGSIRINVDEVQKLVAAFDALATAPDPASDGVDAVLTEDDLRNARFAAARMANTPLAPLSPAATPVSEAGGAVAALRRDLWEAKYALSQAQEHAQAWHRICQAIATVLGLPEPEADFANIVRDWSERALAKPASSPAGVRELAELRAFKAAVYELAGKRPAIRHHTEPAWNVDLFEVERSAALSQSTSAGRGE